MLATMGANDFLDFVFSYFIELGIMMFDRVYLVTIEDDITQSIESFIKKILDYF